MKRWAFLLISLFLIFCYSKKTFAYDRFNIIELNSRKNLTIKTLVSHLDGADVIIIGEIHNEKGHHDFQLGLIKELFQNKIPIALAVEMFRQENQNVLTEWILGRLSINDFIKHYNENWTFSWELYKEIFVYAKDNKIPVIGLNIPRDITEKVAKKGFFSLSKKDLEKLPPDVSCDIDDDYVSFIKKVFGTHKKDEKEFMNFCEAQILWDKSMAFYILNYKKRNPERKIIVLTGAIHAWKSAVPTQIKRLNKDITIKTLLPLIGGGSGMDKLPYKDADYIFYE